MDFGRLPGVALDCVDCAGQLWRLFAAVICGLADPRPSRGEGALDDYVVVI